MPIQSLLYGDAPLLSLMLGCKNGETESEKRISYSELDTIFYEDSIAVLVQENTTKIRAEQSSLSIFFLSLYLSLNLFCICLCVCISFCQQNAIESTFQSVKWSWSRAEQEDRWPYDYGQELHLRVMDAQTMFLISSSSAWAAEITISQGWTIREAIVQKIHFFYEILS